MTSNGPSGRSSQPCCRKAHSGNRWRARSMNSAERSTPTTGVAPRNLAKPQKKPSLQPTSRKLRPARSGSFSALSFSSVRESPAASGKVWYWAMSILRCCLGFAADGRHHGRRHSQRRVRTRAHGAAKDTQFTTQVGQRFEFWNREAGRKTAQLVAQAEVPHDVGTLVALDPGGRKHDATHLQRQSLRHGGIGAGDPATQAHFAVFDDDALRAAVDQL